MEVALVVVGLIMLLGICVQAAKGQKRRRRSVKLRLVRRGR